MSQLRLAARKGDRVALALATEQMRVWALSPRYWAKYLDLLRHPLARLMDLTVIKQGERIARQKGWTEGRAFPAQRRRARDPKAASPAKTRRPRRSATRPEAVGAAAPVQRPLFPELSE